MARPGWYNDNSNRAFPFLETSAGAYYLAAQTVTTMTGALVTPIVVTSESHGLNTGDEINIAGSEGNTSANGNWTITRVDRDSFSLNGSTGSTGDYSQGAKWALNKPPSMGHLPDYYIVDCGFTLGGSVTYPLDPTGLVPPIENTEAAVYLKRVYRAGNTVTFEFRCADPQLHDGYPLIFTRDITTHAEYAVEYVDSVSPDDPDSTSESVPVTCQLPFWSGYIVTGDMALIAESLADGFSLTTPDWALHAVDEYGNAVDRQDGVVEPAVVQNLSRSVVAGINIANDDRTRATPPNLKTDNNPDGCEPYNWPFVTGLTRIVDQCLVGDVRFKPGYNMTILSDTTTNTITFRVGKGAGEGQPCNHETKLFPNESGPITAANTWSNNLLEGGPTCKEVARSFNGIGGPLINFVGGQGVSIIPDPENNKVIIDINFTDMDLCQYSTYSTG